MLEVVDSHHKVLLAWAKCRQSLDQSPILLTLDHHTDTAKPFRTYIKENHRNDDFTFIQSKLIAEMNFNSLESITEAIKRLKNDEHIIAAIKSDIISSAFVLAHNAQNTDLECYKEHRIVCREILDGEEDSVLESSILSDAIKGFDAILSQTGERNVLSGQYILDIDLDFFNTFKSIDPEDNKFFKRLVRGAELVTVATEPEYVKSCSLESGLSSEYLLKKLKLLL